MKYGIKCYRSAVSAFGAAESWLKENGVVQIYADRTAAEKALAAVRKQMASPTRSYAVQEYVDETL